MTDAERRVLFRLKRDRDREWAQFFDLVAPKILHRLSLALYSQQKAEDLTHEIVLMVLAGIDQMAVDSDDGGESQPQQ